MDAPSSLSRRSAYTVEGQEIGFTFAVLEGDVRFVTIRRRR
ncbi:MAG: hypothetical protein U0235_33495 [Polyangiaceae bacterium]